MQLWYQEETGNGFTGIMGRIPFFGAMAFALAIVVGSATAAEVELLDLPGEIDIVSIKGEITEGDSGRFYDLVKERDRITVILQSPGGLVKEALQIGAEIRIKNFATMVASDGECFSACGLIWVSGARRYMSPDSKIGFHAAYREENGEYKESGVANAKIGSFLTHLGLRIEAIRYFTVGGSDEFLLLTPERARSLGIDVYEQNGTELTTPEQAPTVDVYADRFLSYGILRSRCAGYLQMDADVVERAHMDAIKTGQAIAGNDAWVDIWTAMLEEAKAEINTKGPLLVCIKTEAHLRSQAQPTGIHGPSYACSKATTPSELAMCDDESIWAKDRAMNSIYFWIRDNVEPELRKRILGVQRIWLTDRNACGANKECLNSVYDQRLQELKTIVIQ
ncbi:ATP-dependent Clp protease proteolytic subunit [Mesorhizobium sp.]|uniref:ATP-dependent Clp protease proteolytic subunit n=1 Tax=Mesorhizobium sp. TaxID=1871066 RepID=UPI000FE9F964|nr:ATP-dependent Clp protease proteolytic subunit [Mesorhizobium sp.]RWP27776.1 MAG: hypothetical protein EOR03_29985 [Mesorhizobium sp.]